MNFIYIGGTTVHADRVRRGSHGVLCIIMRLVIFGLTWHRLLERIKQLRYIIIGGQLQHEEITQRTRASLCRSCLYGTFTRHGCMSLSHQLKTVTIKSTKLAKIGAKAFCG